MEMEAREVDVGSDAGERRPSEGLGLATEDEAEMKPMGSACVDGLLGQKRRQRTSASACPSITELNITEWREP